MLVIAEHPNQSSSLLAGLIRHQINEAKQIIDDTAQHAMAVIGDREKVLSPAGNVCDVALTNALWLRDSIKAGALTLPNDSTLPIWFPSKPFASVNLAVHYLDTYRNTDTPTQALERLEYVNTVLASALESIKNNLDILNYEVDATFYGKLALYQVMCKVIEHGQYHLGQAAGIAKSLRSNAQ